MNPNSTSRCAFATVVVIVLATAFGLTPLMAQTATVKVWDIHTNSTIRGFDPHETVDDVSGLTNQVGAPAMVTFMEDICGGNCGFLFWNPTTNAFRGFCVTGGFDFAGDINRGAVASVAGNPGGGDAWSAVNGNSSFAPYVVFRGTNSVRQWNLGISDATGIRVNSSNGKVYMGDFSGSQIVELDPSSNGVKKWAMGGSRVYFLAIDGSGNVWATGVAGGAQPDQILRLNPTTNALTRWNLPTNGSFQSSVVTGTPNYIAMDLDANVWFTETAANKIARLITATNVIEEFGKTGLATPHAIATSGSGSSLQAFFTETGAGQQISLITRSAATPTTTTTVTPTSSTVTPTTSTATPVNTTQTTLNTTITPVTCTSAGVDPTGIIRFPISGAGFTGAMCTGFTNPTGMTRVAFPGTVLGSMEGSDHVWELTSASITAPPQGAAGSAGCPAHEHGHVDTANPGHFGTVASPHAHHAQHGHNLVPPTTCPPHAFGHTAGLTADPGEGLFSATLTAEPDFVAAVNVDETTGPARRGAAIQLFGSAANLYLDDNDEQSAGSFTPPESGSPLYYTTSLPEVRVGGVPATVLFSGLAPGLKGVWQINLLIPGEVATGNAPVEITYEGWKLSSVSLSVE